MPDVQSSNLTSANSAASSDPEVTEFIAKFLDRLKSESLKNQLQLVEELASSGEAGLAVLMRFLLDRQEHPGIIEGKVYQTLVAAESTTAQTFLQTHFPQGIVPLRSDRGVDYAPLQALLAQQDFQAADRLTLEKMCELAGTQAVQRKWLYFTEVENFPVVDLQTINSLWLVHSEGKFGFSVQRELWLAAGKNWERLWYQIGWKTGNNWTRYPQEFTWNLSAPRGHLPLSNQLRGVRVIAALLSHPAWE
ncbi:MAG: GUN4 N-terminal ARM-like repeat domain-containing protein [Leptolyngbya sp. IPPAS B-1204]|nr:GUN4 N-terminal ARM-like repeat domain-containing protein [Elainella sp. C42_A2020_010]RNJ70566.1 MAG: GUN4 domain-containing protein [Leptolyngbya sp. IPPAS B-1204]